MVWPCIWLIKPCQVELVNSGVFQLSGMSETVRRDWAKCFSSQAELWDMWRTKMAATMAGLPQAQNQVKQQAGSASDRSLRSVFGRLWLRTHIFSYVLNLIRDQVWRVWPNVTTQVTIIQSLDQFLSVFLIRDSFSFCYVLVLSWNVTTSIV